MKTTPRPTLSIYADASFDHHHKVGAYCIVVVTSARESRPQYTLHAVHDCQTVNQAEYMALERAVMLALLASDIYDVQVFSDSQGAIAKIRETRGYYAIHLRAHTGKLNAHNKRHSWCDSQARRYLRELVLDINNNTTDNTYSPSDQNINPLGILKEDTL